MSGGVALIDYDRDGWPDIYFTNAPDVDMQLAGKKARSALFHNNRDGTFTDVTDKAGVAYPCWANGAVVGDYNNDGWPDLLVTCFGGVVLYRNNGDGDVYRRHKGSGTGGRYHVGHGRRLWRLRRRRLPGPVRVPLRRLRSPRPACLRLDGELPVPHHQGPVRPRRTEGIAGQPVSQQRQRNVHRCFQTSRRRRSAESARPDCRLVGLR